MTPMKFKLLLVFVDDLLVNAVLEASRAAGATGATIVPQARGQGRTPTLTFFGLEYLHPRAIVMILVETRRASEVLEAVTRAGRLDETAETGIALQLDVDSVTGLTEHIRILAEQHPLEP